MLIRLKKSLGQNFLVNPHILDKIVSTAEVTKDDTILEVGPGTGLLTKKLAEKAGKVIAIEKDKRLILILNETFKSLSNTKIIGGDILSSKIADTIRTFMIYHKGPYKIVANIPYYITSNFLRTVFEEWPQPELIVLTIQKEVAQRIMVKPPHMNLLALSVQYYSEPKIVSCISKNNFQPIPKVDSAIISFKPKALGLKPEETARLFRLIKTGYSEKRKQLASVLSRKLKIDRDKIIEAFHKLGINSNARAENLSLEQWGKLTPHIYL